MIIWPDILPPPSQAFNIEQTAKVTRSTMESGRSRQRRRFVSNLLSLSVSWYMSDYEYTIFEAFTHYELSAGASWFEMNIPTGGEIIPHRVRLVEGLYSSAYQADGGWVVSAILDAYKATRFDQLTLFYVMHDMQLDAFNTEVYAILRKYYEVNHV